MIQTPRPLSTASQLAHAFTLGCAFALLGLSAGCGSTSGEKQTESTSEEPPKEEQVSSIPWNKPEKWERRGSIGSGGVGY
jgi:hypothetical protein